MQTGFQTTRHGTVVNALVEASEQRGDKDGPLLIDVEGIAHDVLERKLDRVRVDRSERGRRLKFVVHLHTSSPPPTNPEQGAMVGPHARSVRQFIEEAKEEEDT